MASLDSQFSIEFSATQSNVIDAYSISISVDRKVDFSTIGSQTLNSPYMEFHDVQVNAICKRLFLFTWRSVVTALAP